MTLTSGSTARGVFFLLAGAIWLYLAVTGNIERRQLALPPAGLEVSTVLYAKTHPGGGLLVYDMPEQTAREIMAGKLPASVAQSALGKGWRRTPASPDKIAQWPGAEGGQLLPASLRMDAEFLALADRGLAGPGNWYSFRRGELLILVPASRRIVYAYQK